MRAVVRALCYLLFYLPMALIFVTFATLASPFVLLVCYVMEEDHGFLHDYPEFLLDALKGPFYHG